MTSFGKSQSAQKQGALAGTGLTQQTQRLLEGMLWYLGVQQQDQLGLQSRDNPSDAPAAFVMMSQYPVCPPCTQLP